MKRNSGISGNNIVSAALKQLRGRLPNGWRIEAKREPAAPAAAPLWQPDAVITVRAPDGRSATLLVEAKRSAVPRNLAQLASYIRSSSSAGPKCLFVAPFLSRRARDLLLRQGCDYLDLTGNTRLALGRPALFIETEGAERDPWRVERPARSLKGAKAARIVRALCDVRAPLGVRELAAKAGADPGYASRLLELLEGENVITRKPRGPITGVDWQQLIRRWAEDYAVLRSNRSESYLAPRGIPAFVEGIRTRKLRPPYAITGSLAASRLAPVAPERAAMVYVADPETAAAELDLRSAETGANVVLLQPFDPVVYERAWKQRGLRYAAPSQVAADLLTSPGRGPAEAEALLKWMTENERAWRT